MRARYFFRRIPVLECGASHAAFARFNPAPSGRLRLAHYAVETFPVEPGREAGWLEQMRVALQSLRARVPGSGPVALVLPAHATLVKTIRAPRVAPARQQEVLRFEAGQAMPFGVAEALWDCAPAGGDEREIEALLCAAKRETVEALCAAAESAGFRPACALPAPLATLAACRREEADTAAPVLVASLGARSTTLLLLEPGRCQARVLSLGGNAVTQQIAEGSGCDFDQAERLKLADCPRHLRQFAAESFALRLAQEISRSALYFRRQTGAAAGPARILLTGGAAGLPGLPELLGARLNLPVERLDLSRSLELGPEAASAWPAAPDFPVAELLGAAALQSRPTVDLLPPPRQARERFRRRLPWLAVAALLALAALLPLIEHYRKVSFAARLKTAAIERELAPRRARAARQHETLQQIAQLRGQIAQLQGIHDHRFGWLAMFADLEQRLGGVEDVWLDRLGVAPEPVGEPVARPSSTPSGPLRLAVSGRMLDRSNPLEKTGTAAQARIRRLLDDLAGSPYFAAVESARFDDDRPGVLRFGFVLVTKSTLFR